MGFDQKAMKLLGRKVQVKIYNGTVINGTMSHVSNGFACFIVADKNANTKSTVIRRLSLRDVTSMVALDGR